MSARGGQFGRFRILGPLATGGMAVVYRAVLDGPRGFARPIAIKRIRPELAADDAFRTMMLDEARLSATLQHPNIVQLIECGEVDGELYVAMELLEGIDLRTLINELRARGGHLPSSLAAFIAAQLTAALTYAHTLTGPNGPLRLVHRDVSPSNVMVTADGTVKLLDFGIAKAVGVLRDHETRTGVVKGKFSYMSPEQGSGDEVDHRSDLFSLGVVLYELITLTHPFRGVNDLATLRQVIQVDPPTVTQLAPQLDPAWNELINGLLAKRAEDRFQSGAALERAMLALAGTDGNAATLRAFIQPLLQRPETKEEPTGSVDMKAAIAHAQPEAAAPEPASVPTQTEPHGPPSRTRWPLLLVGLALTVVTAVAVSAWRPNSTPPTTAVAPVPEPTTAPPPAPPPPTPLDEPTPPAAPTEVELQVRGSKGAKVVLDGKLVGLTPLTLRLPVSLQRRQLQVDKQGFARFTQDLPGDAAAVIDVQLKPLRKKQPAGARKAPEDTPDPFR